MGTDNKEEKSNNSEQLKNDKNRIDKIFSNSKEINFYKTKKELGKLFFNNVGLLRNEKQMNEAHNIVKGLISISSTFASIFSNASLRKSKTLFVCGDGASGITSFTSFLRGRGRAFFFRLLYAEKR